MLQQIYQLHLSAWRRITLPSVSREYRTPLILDQRITLHGYEGPLRQIIAADLIENGIADSIDFFHMDALSSAVAMKVDCDLQLTLMASSLYRLLTPEASKRSSAGPLATSFPGFRGCHGPSHD